MLTLIQGSFTWPTLRSCDCNIVAILYDITYSRIFYDILYIMWSCDCDICDHPVTGIILLLYFVICNITSYSLAYVQNKVYCLQL